MVHRPWSLPQAVTAALVGLVVVIFAPSKTTAQGHDRAQDLEDGTTTTTTTTTREAVKIQELRELLQRTVADGPAVIRGLFEVRSAAALCFALSLYLSIHPCPSVLIQDALGLFCAG